MQRQVRQLALLLALAACTQREPVKAFEPAVLERIAEADAGTPYLLGRVLRGDAMEVALTASDGFHINADYPVNFKTDDGVRTDLKDKMKKTECATGKESCGATMQMPNKSGILAFSVCSADLCRIEKVPLKAL